MLQECVVSKCGDTKIFLKIVVEAWIFVACNMQQNQTNLILHVAGNKIRFQKCCKTKLFCYESRWNIFMEFVKNMFLLQLHEKINTRPQSFTHGFNVFLQKNCHL